jgi:hypothetical protein
MGASLFATLANVDDCITRHTASIVKKAEETKEEAKAISEEVKAISE